MLVAPAHELMQGEGYLVGMARAPGNDAFQLDGIVGDGADFHQFGFDGLRVSHLKPAWHMRAIRARALAGAKPGAAS